LSADDAADWTMLREAADEAMGRAYARYSRYRVGAAALVDDGRVVSGCNVENAAYGVTLCAECGLVSQLHMTGGGRLTHFVCVNGERELIMPCGRCRQLLVEHGRPTSSCSPRSVSAPSTRCCPRPSGRPTSSAELTTPTPRTPYGVRRSRTDAKDDE
jgi:cytidine deaminase